MLFKGLPRRIYNDARRQDRTHQYALAAALEAIEDAGLPLPLPEELQFRCGVVSGNCLGGARTVELASQRTGRGELTSFLPSEVLRIMPNAATALIAAAFRAARPKLHALRRLRHRHDCHRRGHVDAAKQNAPTLWWPAVPTA